ncbi:MAG: hypothetical protein Q4P13_06920, partial [Psychrobacter sp.]|nr:hypothetical protein [Psychrobacter sp.]
TELSTTDFATSALPDNDLSSNELSSHNLPSTGLSESEPVVPFATNRSDNDDNIDSMQKQREYENEANANLIESSTTTLAEATEYDTDYPVTEHQDTNTPIISHPNSSYQPDSELNTNGELNNNIESGINQSEPMPQQQTQQSNEAQHIAAEENQTATSLAVDALQELSPISNDSASSQLSANSNDEIESIVNIDVVDQEKAVAKVNEGQSDGATESDIENHQLAQPLVDAQPDEGHSIKDELVDKSQLAPKPIIESNPELESQDPRSLLKCPAQPLEGQWSVEKWDYWLQTAREQQQLDQDELALARQGLMTGECDGEAIFLTAISSPHLQATFTQLVNKIQQQFPNADIRLKVTPDMADQQSAYTPELRQQQRLMQATELATSKLLQSEVMQYLLNRGQGRMGKVKIIGV